MSKETITLELSLAPPHQSGDDGGQLQLPPPATQESLGGGGGDQLQLPPPAPAVQGSLEFTYIPNPYFQRERLYYNFFEPNNGQQLIPQETQPEEEITPLHPWAKSTLCEVQTLNYMLSKNINMISGEMMCKSCKKMERLEYNLREKFAQVCKYIKENIKQLRHRACEEWMNPKLGFCGECRTDTLKPVISGKKEEINWLFLMLGQMLGFCSLDQLQYFCDKNRQQRKAAKDRLVYLAYVVICNQLHPTLAFEL